MDKEKRHLKDCMENGVKTMAEVIEELEVLKARIKELEGAADTAQHALEYVENIVDTVREPLLVLDSNLCVVSANRSFYKTFQVTEKESLDIFLYDLGNQQWNIPKLRELLEDILPQMTSIEDFKVEHDFETIGRRVMLLNARKIYREFNNTRLILLAIEDITERMVAEEAREKYARDLEEAIRLKELFTDILRHDLLNPASAIQNFVGLVLEREQDLENKKYLDIILESSERLVEMIEMTTLYSKLQDTTKIKCHVHDLNIIVKECLDNMEYVIKKAGMEVDYRPKGARPACINSLIENVFTNLISNAVKYAPMGKRIEIDILDKGSDLVVYVKDWGEGIPDEAKEKIFTRFERLGKEEVSGSGLGLAIVKHIVDLHGGNIWIDDNPEGGSVFCVRVPKEG
jgi:two-component system CheB/CheR fusion protein